MILQKYFGRRRGLWKIVTSLQQVITHLPNQIKKPNTRLGFSVYRSLTMTYFGYGRPAGA
jgi:hypothetical protein